jgi:hypothetical protein
LIDTDDEMSFQEFRELQRERRRQKEPGRMEHAKTELLKAGWQVDDGPDHSSFTVQSPSGKRFNFWPYNGYFAGPSQGRGLKELLKRGK